MLGQSISELWAEHMGRTLQVTLQGQATGWDHHRTVVLLPSFAWFGGDAQGKRGAATELALDGY